MLNKKACCPVCHSYALRTLFTANLPVLQNRVYDTQQQATNSVKGSVTLALCLDCKFVFNSEFDTTIVIYDEHYDNSVPSSIFQKYYETIATWVYEKYDLENGVVYDIGCGKGSFLKQLCTLYPKVQGIGIDPSYTGEIHPAENLKFIIDIFRKEQVSKPPALVLVRHVFEHMEYPGAFLKAILTPLQAYENVPLFIEVPDFHWIVQHLSFWDICYEHCNYFSDSSLTKLFDVEGCRLDSVSRAFQDQYLWAEGTINPSGETLVAGRSIATVQGQLAETDVSRFTESIVQLSTNITEKLTKAKNEGWQIVIWGMATKGVIFCNLVDAQRQLVDYCIDMNTAKQEKFIPVSAHKIKSPEVLAETGKGKLLVVIMNPNYTNEIKTIIKPYSFEVSFIDAHGNLL